MRQPFYALATLALLLAACGDNTSTPAAPATTVKAGVGSPVTPSGKARIALLLPLSGQAAPIGQALQQAAELALFDTGAKDLALAAYDAGETPEAAIEAYRKARTDGVALVLGPLFGASARALAPLVAQGGVNVISFSNDEQVAQRGIFIMGIAAPPQVRRVVDYAAEQGFRRFAVLAPQTSYGEQMALTLEAQVPQRGGTVAGVEFYDPNTADPGASARKLAGTVSGSDRIAILVPVGPPRLSGVLGGLGAAGLDNRAAQYLGTGVWDVPNIGTDPAARGGWYAAPDPAARADFERRFAATYGKPPNRLATLAYDAVALAANLARLKPGGDFSAEAITNPSGWSGVDGIFRFLPNGRSERALAVIEVQSNRGVVVSPAPTNFARPSL
ncbi:MAG: penicillin-binding protein activator [Alphaproteobacteria bacterium]|nr:penicillin-binding protein activator [Alphaproteobacteria bacterium]MBV8410113.1 penicillin-binding protein activator [Alphaproteobacteria bacterium]